MSAPYVGKNTLKDSVVGSSRASCGLVAKAIT